MKGERTGCKAAALHSPTSTRKKHTNKRKSSVLKSVHGCVKNPVGKATAGRMKEN
jgi:hypothetical protein